MKHKLSKEDAAPYRYEVDEFGHFEGRKYEELEEELAARERAHRLDWDQGRFDTLDAWQRARDQAERQH